MPFYSHSNIKIFADGADLQGIREARSNPLIKGFTTNPTLMRKANILNYMDFARDALAEVGNLPISFEVFARDHVEMCKQARTLADLGPNVYVKIPAVTVEGRPLTKYIGELSRQCVKVNVTAVLQFTSAMAAIGALRYDTPAIISVFAGRVADTGRDPMPDMVRILESMRSQKGVELLWASPREVLNVYQADEIGCHIITVTSDILKKLDEFCDKDLQEFEVETSQMFDRDARTAGYTIPTD